MALPQPKSAMRALSEERRRFQRVRVDLLGRYMLPDRREFPCQVVNMSPGGMALIAPVAGAARRTRYRLCRSSGPARRPRRAQLPERLCDDDLGDAAQARQARRAADLARQSPHPRPAGRPPPRPCRAAQSGQPLDPAERRQCQLPHHRRLAIRRRHRHRPAAADRRAGHARQGARAASCVISKTASPSSSRGCSIPTFSKTPSGEV